MKKTMCQICKKEAIIDHFLTIKDYEERNSYEIVKCHECNIYKTEPVPENLAEVYSDNPYNNSISGITLALKSWLFNFEIKRLTKNISSNSFLDLGAGSGEMSLNLHNHGFNTIASDAFNERPELIKTKTEIPYLKFNYDENSLESPNEIKGRTVILRHVLEHIRNPYEFLEYFVKQKAAYFYILVPNAESSERKLFNNSNSFWHTPYHLWHFSRESLTALLDSLNLEIVAEGFDTNPSFSWHTLHYLQKNNYPQWLQKFVQWPLIYYIVLGACNLFYRRNAVWAVARIKNNE